MREDRFCLTVATLVRMALQHPEPLRTGGKRPQVESAMCASYAGDVLKPLKDAGIVGVKFGAGGGYVLLRPAEQITLGQVRLACGFTPREGLSGLELIVAGAVCDSIAQAMNGTTVADLERRARACGQEQLTRR